MLCITLDKFYPVQFPSFLPISLLTFCAILPTSFVGKGPLFDTMTDCTVFIRRSPGDLYTVIGFISLAHLL